VEAIIRNPNGESATKVEAKPLATGLPTTPTQPLANAAANTATTGATNQQPTTQANTLPPTAPTPTADAKPFAVSANPPPLAPHAPNQLVANVIGHDADGANILHTPFASLKIYTEQPLPTGTSLLVQADIEPQHLSAAQLQTAPTAASPTAPTKLTGELASLDAALSWLSTNQPELARDVMQRLPILSHKLASTMLFFVSSMKAGGLNDIFGKRAIRQLELNAPDILGRLRQDMGQMQASLLDAPMSHWNMVPIPMMFGHELEQARLFISKEPPESESSVAVQARGQRFILEVEMSQLGPLQFDGFVRTRENSKSFDLMVRSADALPEDVTQGIQAIFVDTMQATGLHGQVIFQHGQQHFVKPLAETAATNHNDGTHTILA
jgi:hypothetical protein